MTNTLLVRLNVKVVPGASASKVAGWLEDSLKVRVAAAPERGKANSAVAALIAAELGLPVSAVCVVSGHSSPYKVLEITGLSLAQVQQAFDYPA